MAALKSNWSLLGAGSVSAIYWSPKDWFDTAFVMMPQVSVSPIAEVPHFFYAQPSGTLTVDSHPMFAVNVWVPRPVGSPGTAEAELAEAMRYEVCRIAVAQRISMSPFGAVVPKDMGVARHEDNVEPRILRYEITLLSSHDTIQG